MRSDLFLEDFHLHFSINLSCLDRTLGCNKKLSDHEINFICLIIPFLVLKVKSLVHEVCKVGDSWNGVHVEADKLNLLQHF